MHRLPGPPNKKGAEAPCLPKSGAPGEIRTPDHQVRSLVLYPAELRARRSEIMGDAGGAVNACDETNPRATQTHPVRRRCRGEKIAALRRRIRPGGVRGIRTLDQAFDPILP